MSLPEALINAYQETHYHIYTDPSFYLKIGTYSAELAQLHGQFRITTSAVIIAWNPYSEILSAESNSLRQKQLYESVVIMGFRSIPALGQHPSMNWPGEESLFIAGIELSDASELGKKFGQNAIVFSTVDAVPKIITLV